MILRGTISSQFDAHGITSQGSSYETEYDAILNYATTQGWTLPSVSVRTKQNTFLASLKSGGIWSELDVLWVFAHDADGNFGRINWKSPGDYVITLVNSPSFTTNQGFAGNGTSSYLNTGWKPGVNGVQITATSISAIVHSFFDTASNTHLMFGVRGSDTNANHGRMMINPRNTTNQQHAYQMNVNATNSILAGVATVSGEGLFHGQRTGSSAQRLLRNGTEVGTGTNSAGTLSTRDLYLLAENQNNTAANFSARTISMAAFGSSLSGKETDMYNAWNTYLTNL